jgi:hypothetical protein
MLLNNYSTTTFFAFGFSAGFCAVVVVGLLLVLVGLLLLEPVVLPELLPEEVVLGLLFSVTEAVGFVVVVFVTSVFGTSVAGLGFSLLGVTGGGGVS